MDPSFPTEFRPLGLATEVASDSVQIGKKTRVAADFYSLEVDEDIFDSALLPTQAASSHRHLVLDVVEADGGAALACRLKTHLVPRCIVGTDMPSRERQSYLPTGGSPHLNRGHHFFLWHPDPEWTEKKAPKGQKTTLTGCRHPESHQIHPQWSSTVHLPNQKNSVRAATAGQLQLRTAEAGVCVCVCLCQSCLPSVCMCTCVQCTRLIL